MKSKLNNLHAIRAIAALGVFIHHVEEFKKHSQIFSIGDYKGISALGGTSVTAFFALSGFLITYLLIKEKEANKTIHIRFFYLRRMLRIWPLYFLTLIIYKIILPELPFDILESLQNNIITLQYESITNISLPAWLEWLLLIFLLPHILLSLGVVFNPAHVWSIGVEEFFYIFWPWVILLSSHYIKIFFKILISYLLLLYSSLMFLMYLSNSTSSDNIFLSIAKFTFSFFYFERISCMSIGAIAAYIFLFKKNTILKKIQSAWIFIPSMVTLSYMILNGVVYPIITNEIYSVLFTILILNLTSNSYSIFKLVNNKLLIFLGDISYGIYMFNPLTILITIELFYKLNLNKNSFIDSYLIFYLISLLATILISYLSYRFIEKPFLNFKKYNK